MQRDMELIRAILIKAEQEYKAGDNVINPFLLKPDNCSDDVFTEHLILMYEADLFQKMLIAEDSDGKSVVEVGNLSNMGYDLLEKIRQDTIWNKTKEVIKEKALPPAIEVITSVSSAIVTTMVQAALKGIIS